MVITIRKPNLSISNSEVRTLKKFRFFLKLVASIAVVAAIILFSFMPQYTTGYTAAMVDKIERLRSLPEPKIVLAGNSNVAFGFDSARIQAALHMPVVNGGLHGGLGEAFHTDAIKPYIREGDIIIIFPSQYNTLNAHSMNSQLAWTTIENHFFLWSSIAPENYWDMALAFPSYLRNAINFWLNNNGNAPNSSLYSRASFNQYGDIVYPRPMYKGYANDVVIQQGVSQAMLSYWNDYHDYVISKGATLLMSCPPIASEFLTLDLALLQKQVEEGLDFPMISQLSAYVYPQEYFYNTALHLCDTGVVFRTEQLIADLKAWQSETKGANSDPQQ